MKPPQARLRRGIQLRNRPRPAPFLCASHLLAERGDRPLGRSNSITADQTSDLSPKGDERHQINEGHGAQEYATHEKVRGRPDLTAPCQPRQRGEKAAMAGDEPVAPFQSAREHRRMDVPIQQPLFVRIVRQRSEEHTSELQSHSFISYAVFCLKTTSCSMRRSRRASPLASRLPLMSTRLRI